MADFLSPSDYFEGAIFARGLQIEEGIDGTPPDVDNVEWIDRNTQFVGSTIFGTHVGGQTSLVLNAFSRAVEDALVQLTANGQGGLVPSFLVEVLGGVAAFIVQIPGVITPKTLIDSTGFSHWVFNNTSPINLTSGAIARKLLDNTAKSDFVQGLAEQGLKVIRGTYTTTLPTIVAGTGFSLTRNGVGDVTITFTSGFSVAPTIVFSGHGGAAQGVLDDTFGETTTTARLRMATTAGAAQEGTVHFMAIGPI